MQGMAFPNDVVWLSVSKISEGLRCRRRLVHELNPNKTPARSSDGVFRLHRAITNAISESHRIVQELSKTLPNAELLTTTLEERLPPIELGREEVGRFRAALVAYADSWADGDAEFIPAPDAPYRRPSIRRTWGVSGTIDLRFRRNDGTIEIRKVAVGGRPSDKSADVAIADVLRFSLLGAPGVLAQLYVPQDVGTPGGVLTERSVTDNDIAAARVRVRDAVDAAQDLLEQVGDGLSVGGLSGEGLSALDSLELTTPGWWCNQCPYVRGCPALPQQSSGELIGSYPDTRKSE